MSKNKINLFIDANIFLNFYSYKNEDLNSLNNLHALAFETNKIRLYISDYLKQEFYRQRDKEIKKALNGLEGSSVKLEVPNMCFSYKEARELELIKDKFTEKRKILLNKLNKDIKKEEIKADKVVKDLFAKNIIELSDDVINCAKKRIYLGNPPGKKGSIGDALHWEFLLENIYKNEDLYFISNDGDFMNYYNPSMISTFLKKEWEEKKESNILFYRSLKQFFKNNFPNINITSDYIQELKIQDFCNSNSFAETRENIEGLKKIKNFTNDQIDKIVGASITNDQIYNAHEYSPHVGKCLLNIIKGKENILEEGDYYYFLYKFSSK